MSSVVQLERVDETSADVIKLPVGISTLGRGSFLSCGDKKVSRNHAEIDIKDDGSITLISKHVNPCFIQSRGKRTTLKRNLPYVLHDGDVFSLLPDSFVYKVVYLANDDDGSTDDERSSEHGDNSTDNVKEIDTETNSKRKRALPSFLQDSSDSVEKKAGKICKISSSKHRDSVSDTAVKRLSSNNDSLTKGKSSCSKMERIATDGNVSKSDSDSVGKSNRDEAPEENDVDDEKTADTSSQSCQGDNSDGQIASKQKRRVCEFRYKCYRSNRRHKENFIHPGDTDYESEVERSDSDDDDDVRPECEYGIECYRKNPKHREKYKHTKKQRPKRAAAAKKREINDTHSSDDSLDDSFIDDDSDIYSPASDESYDEDSGTLSKDAKRFVKKRPVAVS